MDIYCEVTATGFVPIDDMDWERKKRLKIGQKVKCSITQPRNIGFHHKFFALLNIVLDNMEEHVQKERNIYSIEALLMAVKIDLGYYERVSINGEECVKLKSISWARMSQEDFERFYEETITDVLNTYLPKGTSHEDLIQEVVDFTSRRN